MLGAVAQSTVIDIGRHDRAHRRVGRGTPLQDDLACVIALGNDADQASAIEYQHCADAFVRHQPDRVDDRRSGPIA
jgi:hypothetical protein